MHCTKIRNTKDDELTVWTAVLRVISGQEKHADLKHKAGRCIVSSSHSISTRKVGKNSLFKTALT